MTLRLITTSGQNLIAHFAGGHCDLSRTAPGVRPERALAKPGDNLQALVDTKGTVVLAKGTYRLDRPLVLGRAVTLTSDGEAILVFDQAPSERPWSAAIKIHSGNTTLNGFAVRFAGPVRWNPEISWGPAVIGMTDNFDPAGDEPKVNITITHLDIEIPPIERSGSWVEALRLMRLVHAKSGVIADNILRGGPIEFFEGPCA